MAAATPGYQMPDVLLVEDNPLHVRLVRSMLAEVWPVGDHLAHVNRLDKAIDYLKENRPACVLLDLVLPDAAGLEGLQALRAIAPNVPIVVLSAHDDDETALLAIRQGAQDYLVKGDVHAEVLMRVIQFSIERGKAGFSGSTVVPAAAVLDLDGRIVRADAALGELLGRSLGALFRLMPTDVVHPHDLGAWTSELERLEETLAPPTRLDLRFLHADGSPIPVRVELAVVCDERNKAAGFTVGVTEQSSDQSLTPADLIGADNATR